MCPPSQDKRNRHRNRNKRKETKMRMSNYIDDAKLSTVSAAYELYGCAIKAILSTPDGYIIEWDHDSVCATLHAVSISYLPDSTLTITATFLDSDGFLSYAMLQAVSVRYEPNGDTTLATTFTTPGWFIRSPIINIPHQQQTGSFEGESNEPIQHAHPYKSEIDKIEKLAQKAEALGDMVEKESAQLRDNAARLLKLFKPSKLREEEE
ncbi:uncharacterized protein LTHEOB_2678 [Lasiodiplodia theobromae]|uniref:uncharacterized protein n=1 Tax=Lasiodiplodia theobromae TaxID=45133 RepID=UPI0015C3F681|nr:uncharacterized protein LTHEOB_2678 [Lasiodiplodia theobromae]KAF4534703.1 hypothetical protein LTHEOB_2678 [Lasiodiplodia theobromae]